MAVTPADQTHAIQAHVDSGRMLGEETLDFAKQVTSPNGRGLLGVSFNQSVLAYYGYDRVDGCLNLPAGSWGFKVGGFALRNTMADRIGTGIRCGASPAPGFGTQSGTGRFEQLLIDGFEFGARFGDASLNSSSSEITLDTVKFARCLIALMIETQNSLNFKIDQFGASDCDVALKTLKAGCVHLRVGSFTNVPLVWDLSGAGVYSATGLRTENCGYLLKVGFELAQTDVTLVSCMTNRNSQADQVDVLVSGGAKLTVIGGQYAGKFRYEGFKEKEPGYGIVILDGVSTYNPVLLEGTKGTRCRYEARNCSILNPAGEVIRRVDQKGILGEDLTVPHAA